MARSIVVTRSAPSLAAARIETHPTAAEITALRIEAGEAGDMRLVETCRRAEEGSRRARATVARILAAARQG